MTDTDHDDPYARLPAKDAEQLADDIWRATGTSLFRCVPDESAGLAEEAPDSLAFTWLADRLEREGRL